MNVAAWLDWIREEPTNRRKRRLVEGLNNSKPDWREVLVAPWFKSWAEWVNPQTRKSRFELLLVASREDYDAESTARLLSIAEWESLFIDDGGRLNTKAMGFLLHGQFIDHRYEVLLPLGRGGCGFVLLVYSHEVNKFFALKSIRKELADNTDSVGRFLKEASIWIDVGTHPNIVRAEFVDTVNDEVVILMELIEKDSNGLCSLQEHIDENRKFRIDEILHWAIGICRGLTHAYGAGLRAHRDLKPDNIMIGQSNQAKITDFGISSFYEESISHEHVTNISPSNAKVDETAQNALLGSLPYMAPEQFISAKNCNEQSDIYSFGVILYQLISRGAWPYGDINTLASGVGQREIPLLFFKLHSEAKPKHRFHKLYKICVQCLAKDPKRRPSSFKELEEKFLALSSYLNIKLDHENQVHESGDEFNPWDAGQKGASLLRLGRYQEALEVFDEILEKFPLGDQWEFDKALTLSKLNRDEEALSLYKQIIERDSSHIGALVNGGLLLLKKGEVEAAREIFLQAIQEDQQAKEAFINLGNIEYKNRCFDLAIQYYQKAVAIDATDATGWYNLGLACLADGKEDLAQMYFEKFLEQASAKDSRREYVLKQLGG